VARVNSFDEIFLRLKVSTDINSQGGLARFLGIKQASVSGAKKRGVFPEGWGVKLAKKYGLDLNYLLCGEQSRVSPDNPEPFPGSGELLKITRMLLIAKDEALLLQKELLAEKGKVIQLQRELFESKSSVSNSEIMKMLQELKDGHDNFSKQSLLDQEVSEHPLAKSAKKKQRTSRDYSDHSWEGWKEEERGLAINA